MSANFLTALDVPMDQIERPKPVPTGTYIGQISGLPTSRDMNTAQGEKEVMEIPIKLIAPRAPDDPEAAAAFDLQATRPLRRSFWFNKPASAEDLWAFKQFCKNTLGIDTSGKTGKQVAAEMQGKQLLVTVGNNTYQDKNTGEMVIGSQITQSAAL